MFPNGFDTHGIKEIDFSGWKSNRATASQTFCLTDERSIRRMLLSPCGVIMRYDLVKKCTFLKTRNKRTS
jgi:hypothetical protein